MTHKYRITSLLHPNTLPPHGKAHIIFLSVIILVYIFPYSEMLSSLQVREGAFSFLHQDHPGKKWACNNRCWMSRWLFPHCKQEIPSKPPQITLFPWYPPRPFIRSIFCWYPRSLICFWDFGTDPYTAWYNDLPISHGFQILSVPSVSFEVMWTTLKGQGPTHN